MTAKRCRRLRVIQKPSRLGAKADNITQATKADGSRGCSSVSRMGSRAKNGVSSSSSTKPASTCSTTRPRPNGRANGYNRAAGHSASNTKPPRASGTNQRARQWLHRSNAPNWCSSKATPAPNTLPKKFSKTSKLEGTRAGRYTCKVSRVSDNTAHNPTANTPAHRAWPVRQAPTAKNKPKGA